MAVFNLEKPSVPEQLLFMKTRLDGKLDVTVGATTLTTNAVFDYGNVTDPTTGKWRSIEVLYDVGGDVKIYVDDALDLDMNVTTSNDDLERVRFYWANFGDMGIMIDDYIQSQNNSGAAAQRVGPVRIAGWTNKGDEVTGFGRVGAATNARAVGDRNGITSTAPDDDSTFIQTTVPTKDLYTLNPANICTGRDLAVATTTVAKLMSGTPHLRSIARVNPSNSANTVIGFDQPLSSGYQVFNNYSTLSPLTNDYWIDGEIENGLWGVEALGSGIVRVTMHTVEKIQSLRNVEYRCGKLSSYAVKGK